MGYVHDTGMTQYIPPTLFHCVTGTWTLTAGAVTGTISKHKSSNSETTVVTIPIMIPSNSVGLKGGYFKSIEIDYEFTGAAATSVTAALHKVVRGADTAVAVVSSPACTQDLTAATTAATQDQHRLTVTLTTPAWIDNDEYYLCELTIVASTAVIEMLGAVVNFTLRV